MRPISGALEGKGRALQPLELGRGSAALASHRLKSRLTRVKDLTRRKVKANPAARAKALPKGYV